MILAESDGTVYDPGVTSRKTKGTLGGWRPGAGRKPTLEDPVSLTFDAERPQVEALREIARERQTSVADLLRKALDAFLKRQRRK